MPYKAFYQLDEEPFANAPAPKLYVANKGHEYTLAKLTYAAERMKGLAVCVGEPGTGKTMLARRLLNSLPAERYAAALLVIVHAGITADWLLKRIALQLGVKNPSNDKLTLLSQVYKRLVQIHREGKKTVILIDEAQMFASREIMEEFRGLLNLEVPGSKLITFIFFGLPELDERLHIDEPLKQRVALRCELAPFEMDTATAYLKRRLELAGAARSIFSSGALRAIVEFANGVPRAMNTLADNALFEGAMNEKEVIDAELVAEVARELNMNPIPDEPEPLDEDQRPEADESPDPAEELAAFDQILQEMERY